MEFYREFASIYDRLIKKQIDYAKWYQRISEILLRYNCKPDTALEIACGTGNLTRYLCEEGYAVTAFDYSEDMLTIAYDKLKEYKNVKFFKQNMIEFNMKLKYDMILSMCDGINYITDYGDLCKVFCNVRKHLKDNGLFIFDINSYYKLKNGLGNNIFIQDDEDIFYTWENIFDDESKCSQSYITFFVREKDLYKRFDEIHIKRAYKEDEIKAALLEADLKLLAIHDGYTIKPPNNKSERLSFVVEK